MDLHKNNTVCGDSVLKIIINSGVDTMQICDVEYLENTECDDYSSEYDDDIDDIDSSDYIDTGDDNDKVWGLYDI